MLICKECFADEELRGTISASNTIGECEICHSKEKVIDSSEFADFFESLLNIFEPSNTEKNIIDYIQEEWHIFKNKDVAKKILEDFITIRKYQNYTLLTTVDFKKDIKKRISVWDRLKTTVKEKTRFFINMDEFAIFNYLELKRDSLLIEKGRKLYRSRITPIGYKKIRAKDMGCPPKELATAGRANPIGIPYLYLSDTAKTTYFEVRAIYLDNLSVGTFSITRNLRLIDFSDNVNLYLSFIDSPISIEETIIRKKIINSICADLSKPLRRYDSELEYVPTQLICEYCLHELKADGISFNSSLHKGGRNYVLFDQTAAKCIKVDCHEITKIDIDIK